MKTQIWIKGEKIIGKPEVIIVNSFGAMNDFFKYCKSVFIGKSTIEKLKNDSEKLLSTYQAKLNDSKKECDLILQNAKKISDKDSKELTEKFKNNLKSRERSVEEKITNLKNEALKEIELKAAMLSTDAVREIMKNEIDEKKRADINFTSVKQSINKINS